MQQWILDNVGRLPYAVRMYGSQVVFSVSAMLLVLASVVREIELGPEGKIGRGPVARILTVALVVLMVCAALLTAYRLFSQALTPDVTG
ncbi:hypothetical protein GOOTI_090_00100 [Gordonia otitidis NBRC 100426]|uniref:Uncharacterized protein n=1 Tax=Gordonia otitidis (strain DSM 44809 / CCUG 52243 / JCM 12355 / NBRC 100426 / IFM 10032) TaxID=1108044 RepID=H5TKH2_GORO1|nr:hypothetical protein GOOTI_090_00100 [Gordonia otitidis NBRC 100426]